VTGLGTCRSNAEQEHPAQKESIVERTDVDYRADRHANPHVPEVRFLRLKDVLALCGKSRSSVYEAIRKGEFPKPVKLRSRSYQKAHKDIAATAAGFAPGPDRP